MFSLIPEIDNYEDLESNSGDNASSSDEDSKTDGNIQIKDEISPSVNADVAPPKGTSATLWEKFKTLQKRREEAAKEKVPDYKRKRRKRKYKSNQDDQTNPSSSTEGQVGNRDLQDKNNGGDDDGGGDTDRGVKQKKKAHWQNIKQLIGINDHLKGTDQGRLAPKSGLEKKIEQAVGEGEFETAEELSDRLATRNLGERISEAIDSRDFLARRKEEDEAKKAKQKKEKPPWTFEAKHRWEMKSNM